VAIEFINSAAEKALLEYQSRVSATLNLIPDANAAKNGCGDLGVPYYKLEMLLCSALARYELIPLRIAVMREARADSDRFRGYLARIDAAMRITNHNADWTDKILVVEDPERISDDLLDAVAKLIGHYDEGASAERERLLRARLGIPPGRLKKARSKDADLARLGKEKAVARYAVIGFVSIELMRLFSDHRPHDELVADLLGWLFFVSADDLPHCRAAYLKLQEVS
jgi:hypothetical protein